MKILCAQAITPDEVIDRALITIDGEKIVSVEPSVGARADLDASDKIAVPGFVDLHNHGGVGYEVVDGTLEAMRAISAHLAANGVTSWLPTALTNPWGKMRAAVEAIDAAMREGSHGADVLGAHLEGPYLNPAKKGAQPEDHVLPPAVGEMDRELGDLISVVKYIAIACEMPGGLDLIRELRSKGIVVSLAHTEASYEQGCVAFDAGVTSLTHVFNAMKSLHHREPGALAAALLDERITAELVWDNYHVLPPAARIAVKLKGPDRIALVSDAVSASGLKDGTYELGGQAIEVKAGLARLMDGTIAGATITLDQAMRNAAKYFPLKDAVKMATSTPATSIGMGDRKGRLAPGYDADITLLNKDLGVESVYIRGREYRRN